MILYVECCAVLIFLLDKTDGQSTTNYYTAPNYFKPQFIVGSTMGVSVDIQHRFKPLY